MMIDKAFYNITVENQDIIVRLNRDIIDRDTLTKFLDYLELEAIRKRSCITEKQAATLAKEIDTEVWSNLKHKFVTE